MGSKNKPGAFDCYSKAEPDEPMFVLLGRDPSAALLIGMWAALREAMGEDEEKVDEARDCADACLKWARDHGKSERLAEVHEKWLEFLEQQLTEKTAKMIKGLVRFAELREQDEPGGKVWDDKSREALELARQCGWGKDQTGRLP